MEDPGLALRRITMAMRTSRALYAAAELGIADHLAAGSKTPAELAILVGANPDALRRLLRALSAAGVFKESGPDAFALTDMGDRLRRDHPQSFRAGVLFLTGPERWEMWSDFLDCVRTGQPSGKRAAGQTIFEAYALNPAQATVANDAMKAFTILQSRALLAAFDFSRFGVLMDVGGGTGELIGSVLSATPALRGLLFDLPHVVAGAPPVLQHYGVADRCACLPGNFFEAVPKGADTIMLKQVVHDWDNARARELLICCREALPRDGVLLIIDRVMPERIEPGLNVEPFLLDLEMLVGPGGRERTYAEFADLLSVSGFQLAKVHQTTAPVSILEAVRDDHVGSGSD